MRYFILALMLIALPVMAGTIYSPSISVGKMEIDEPVMRNSKSILPGINVFNRNEEDLEVEVKVANMKQEELPVGDWVEFKPDRFVLGPGETKFVQSVLKIPKDAINGDYQCLLKVATVVGEGNGAKIVPGVATVLKFRVEGTETWAMRFSKQMANAKATVQNNLGLAVIILMVIIALMVIDRFRKRLKVE